MVYRRRPSSGPAEQWKKVDLDWKSGSATTSGMRGFVQPADIAPNMGAKLGGREEERKREGCMCQGGLWGVYIVGSRR
jgi:hypothetical protein